MMHVITTYTGVDAPIDRVWAILSDVRRFPEWNPMIRRFEGDFEPGGDDAIFVEADKERRWRVHVENVCAPHEFA